MTLCVGIVLMGGYFVSKILPAYRVPPLPGEFVWTMVNVNQTTQGDAHLLQILDGMTVLIDAGYYKEAKTSLLPFLEQNRIQQIDLTFITHPHRDHYEGISAMLDAGIRFEEVYFNLPDKALCDQEIPWGCHYSSIISLRKRLQSHGVKLKEAKAGQNIILGPKTTISLLYAFDGVNTPVGKTDINDMSMIMMLHHAPYKFLFTGDLNHPIGSYISRSNPELKDLKATILKVPHHGTESAAPNQFFLKVNPQYILVPSPNDLWCNDRSARIRKWFQSKKIPIYVNGFSGHVQVIVKAQGLKIIPEKPLSPKC